jgi:biotin carboxyl carrier protein
MVEEKIKKTLFWRKKKRKVDDKKTDDSENASTEDNFFRTRRRYSCYYAKIKWYNDYRNVATWLKKVGDTIKEGDILAEIETDKANGVWIF